MSKRTSIPAIVALMVAAATAGTLANRAGYGDTPAPAPVTVTVSPSPTSTPTTELSTAPSATHTGTALPDWSDGDPVTRAAALAVIDALPVAVPGSQAGYERKAWPHWRDPAGPVCNARVEVMKRDMTGEILGGCKVLSGLLADPYTGRTINYTSKAPSTVQIDHVVPLSEAHKSGGASWSTDRKEALANDPLNLLAVDGPANMSKGDKRPDEWMPVNRSAACFYAHRYASVKAKYGLTVTAPERDSLRSAASTCEAR